MMITKYKSAEELRSSLGESKRFALFSCGVCANLCGVGGIRGANFMKGLLEEWGGEVIVTRTVLGLCAGTIMRQAQRRHLKPIVSKIDALVVLSCAGGVKSAVLCNPGVPVIAACDTVGFSAVLLRDGAIDDPVARSLCFSCEHCVLSFTGGICPMSMCPAKMLYGPCNKAPEEGTQCAVDPQRDCVWREIEKRGADLAALQELKRIHKANEQNRLPPIEGKASPPFLIKLAGSVVAGLPGRSLEILHWAAR